MIIHDWSIQDVAKGKNIPCLYGYTINEGKREKVALKISMFIKGRQAKIAVCGSFFFILEEKNISLEYKAKFPNAYRDIRCEKTTTKVEEN